MRILCYFNHFYGASTPFRGKSTTAPSDQRLTKVLTALDALRALPFSMNVRVCGMRESSLLPVDIDFSSVINDPRMLVYASIEKMVDEIEHYDYFLNIEDDILVSAEILYACIEFNKTSYCNEIFLPNRIEYKPNSTYQCVDLTAIPRWKNELQRKFRGVELGVAHNPHSGLSFLSRNQFMYAATRVKLSSREVLIGDYMASAFANLHAPFLIWRAKSYLRDHSVVHLDHRDSPISNGIAS